MTDKFIHAWDKVNHKIELWFDKLILIIPNVIIATVVFTVVLLLSKYVNKLVMRFLNKTSIQESMRKLIARLVSIIIISCGLFIILGVLNLSKALNTILAGAGVLGLAVGLALQGALANTYSGIVLSYIKNLKYGDWIETNGYQGEIVDIDLRVLTLKQVDNNLVYIPNRLVIENSVKNYSSTPYSKVILTCGVGYESDLRFVKDITIGTIKEQCKELVMKEDILFLWREYADSSINYEIRFWIKTYSPVEVAKVKSEAIMLIKEAYDKHNINIPFPIRTLDIPKGVSIVSNK